MSDEFVAESVPVSETPSVQQPGPGVGADELSPALEEVAATKLALAAAEDKYLRLAAEYDNFRRRTLREKAEAGDRGAMEVLARLLQVLDDLDRLETAERSTTVEVFREGYDLIYRKLQQTLEGLGLERLVPDGEPFNPEEHEAVSVIAPDRPEQDHLVSLTLQTGYRFRGTVVRPAKVQVYSAQGTA